MNRCGGLELFLVEDMILTLGNLRGSLAWLGDDQRADPARHRAGLQRIGAQIDMLEARARDLCTGLRDHARYHMHDHDAAEVENIFADLSAEPAAGRQ